MLDSWYKLGRHKIKMCYILLRCNAVVLVTTRANNEGSENLVINHNISDDKELIKTMTTVIRILEDQDGIMDEVNDILNRS